MISYNHLEKLMRVTENPDFFAGLPMQTAQAIVKQAVTDFNNWLKSLKAYAKHPENFLGRPKMPHYKKDSLTTVTVTIGAVTGLIGGIRVYQKFSSGDPDTSKTAASWFGACIFLILVGTVLESFFF